jgi:hypothetical protein
MSSIGVGGVQSRGLRSRPKQLTNLVFGTQG